MHRRSIGIKYVTIIMLLLITVLVGCSSNTVTYRYKNSDNGSGVSISKSVYGDNELKLYIKGLSDKPSVCAFDDEFNRLTDNFDVTYKNNILTIKGSDTNKISGLDIEETWSRFYIRYLDSDEYALMYEVEASEIGWVMYGDKEKYYTADELAKQQAQIDAANAEQEENFELLKGMWICNNDPNLYLEFYESPDGNRKFEWNEVDELGEYVTSGISIAVINIYATKFCVVLEVVDDPYYGYCSRYEMSEDKTKIIEKVYNDDDNIYVKVLTD